MKPRQAISMPNARENYLGLDIIRFAAATAVALYHLGYWLWLPSVSGNHAAFPGSLAMFAPALRWGWVGVPIFFVLSGFVIAFSAEGKTVRSFLRSRFLRLYPAAWICATISLLITFGARQGLVRDYLNSLILWPVGPWISSVYWTLGVEIIFYAAMAVAIRCGVKIGKIGLVLGYMSSMYWIGRLTDFGFGGHAKHLFEALENQIGYLTLIPHGCYFAIGILLFEAVKAPDGGRSIPMSGSIFVAAGLISLTSSGRFYVHQNGGPAWLALAPALIWLSAVASIVLVVVFNVLVAARTGACSRTIRVLGLATYPLYLVHSELGIRIMLLFRDWGAAALSVAFLAVLGVALLVTRGETLVRDGLLKMFALKKREPSLPAQLP